MLKKGLVKKLLPIAAATSLAVTSLVGGVTPKTIAADTNSSEVKNVIMIIADGTGLPYYSAHRYMNDDPNTPEMEPTVFDDYFVGLQTVWSITEGQNVPDSAATATAMASGVKTYNGAIGVDLDKKPVKTVLEQAKENGLSTGLISTSRVNHATPAAYAAHDEYRKNYDAIADDYYDELINGEHKVDVILGGGDKYFERDDRNLAKEFQNDGFSYVKTRDALLADTNDQVLGLFGKDLPKVIDRTEEVPSLVEMTQAALDRLSKDKDGFFLVVEASQIDWAGHDNDIVSAMSEMQEYADTFELAVNFAKENGETQVIATADHSTGGLSIAANGPYNFYVDPIKAFKRTPDFMAGQIVFEGADVEEMLNTYVDLQLAPEEIQSVKDAAEEAVGMENSYDGYRHVDNAIEAIVNNRSLAGWTTSGHTGEEVPVLAYGPKSDQFRGLIDNTKHAEVIFDILEENKNGSKKTAIHKGQIGKVIASSKATLYKKTDAGLVKVKDFTKGNGYRVYKVDNTNKWYEVGANSVVKFDDNVNYMEVK